MEEKRGSVEKAALRWLDGSQRVRELLAKAKEQKALKVLEQEHPWLGSLKWTLRKDGSAFDIPEGPKVATVTPAGERTAARPSSGTPAPSHEKTAGEKRKFAP